MDSPSTNIFSSDEQRIIDLIRTIGLDEFKKLSPHEMCQRLGMSPMLVALTFCSLFKKGYIRFM